MLDVGAAAEIADRFELGAGAVLTGPVARGEQGRVWRLDAPAGGFAVKEPFERQDEDGHRSQAAFHDAVSAAGVAVPPIVRTADGALFTDIGGAQVRVYGWMDLDTPDPGIDPDAVGRVVAAIHQVTVDGPHPLDPWYTDPVGADAWDILLARSTAAGAPFATALAALRHEIVATEGLMEAPPDPVTCHRDLFADNVVLDASGRVVVIDWDNSGLADQGHELAVVAFEFANGDPARAAALCRAYEDAGGPARIDGPASFTMAIAQLGHITEMAGERWLATTDPVERSRLESRVAEFTDRPLVRSTIDALLHAIRH